MTSLYESLKPDALDEIIVEDLISCYSYSDSWELKDALRKVIRHYTTEKDYQLFKEKYVESYTS